MTHPLNHLCKKSTPWHFGMEADASDSAIAGILSVTTEDGDI